MSAAFVQANTRPSHRRAGFTLIEIVMVLALLGLMVGLVTIRYSSKLRQAKITIALADMHTIRDALIDDWLPDISVIPNYNWINPLADRDELECMNPRIHNLLARTNRVGNVTRTSWFGFNLGEPDPPPYGELGQWGWNGPYLRAQMPVQNINSTNHGTFFPGPDDKRFPEDDTFLERNFYFAVNRPSYYGTEQEFALGDSWGNPYIIQFPSEQAFPSSYRTTDKIFALLRWQYARIVSAGPNGILETPRDELCAGMTPFGADVLGDDLVLFLNRIDHYEELE